MEDGLRRAMASGVFVEFCDERGNTVGQAVFTDWQGRPVPVPGDTVCAAVLSPITGRRQKLIGCVIKRHFEVQYEEDGRPCVWVRLQLQTVSKPAIAQKPRPRIQFSVN
ncbi:MAG TPA: hypothetical protein VHC19_25145 [Pirellulales bacterium]|nr:hypothetical protein [Pirellulales bacterium]